MGRKRKRSDLDREFNLQRRRERDDLDAEHKIRYHLPGVCPRCGATVFLELWPQVFWAERGGDRHICRHTDSGAAALHAARRERRRCEREALVRKARAIA